MSLNVTALDEYSKELNFQANLREYLTSFIINQAITIINTIKLQSSVLAQLTQATSQLTRKTLVSKSTNVFRFGDFYFNMKIDACFREMLSIISIFIFNGNKNSIRRYSNCRANQLIQCATNVLTVKHIYYNHKILI